MKFNLKLFILFFISNSYVFGQNELCNQSMFFDCGTIDGNNDSGLFNSDTYCGTSSGLTGPEVVYEITPTNTQVYTFTLDVFGAGNDLDMFLLDAGCDPSNCLASSDAASSTADDEFAVTLFTGVTYYLVIDGDGGTIAEYFLELFCSPPFECEFEDIECNEIISASNDTGVFSVDTYCGGSNINMTGSEKIFRFIPPTSQNYYINLTGFSGDLDLFILDEACDTDNCLANTDGASGSIPDDITIFLIAGQEYYFVIDGDGGTISDFELEIQCSDPCQAEFSYTEDCGKVQFINNSTGSGLTYEWLIDGITYAEENPCVQFTTVGPHQVILEVFSFGCESEFSLELEVEICAEELFCDCCPDGPQYNFETEPIGPVSSFPQAPFNAVYGDPQYVVDGCDNPQSIQINGPSFAFGGDGVEYSLSGAVGQDIIFEEGMKYCISFCYKAPEIDGNIKLRLSDTQQTNGTCSGICNVVSTTPTITQSDGWQTHQFVFTASNNYYSLTFSTDATHPLDGTVPMLFDNVCINEYNDTCTADFSWTTDGCGNLDLLDNSCGDNLNILWVVNGSSYTTSPLSFSGAGTYNVSLTVQGADGCMDSVSDVIVISSPQAPILTCPPDETVSQIILPNENCVANYIVPSVSSTGGGVINCTFNGNLITPGTNITLLQGNNVIVCNIVDECGNEDQCQWNVLLVCEIEEPMECDVDPNCAATSNLNLGTGIDLLGNQIPSGTGQTDPVWRLINNAPVGIACTNPNLASLNGSAYLTNYVFPNTTAWVNLPGVTVIAPMDLGNGNGAANMFGCNNIQNSLGERVPYIFERLFCICTEDEYNINLDFRGDDQLTLELWDLSTNSLIGTSVTYVYPNATSNWNQNILLPQGNYSLRAKLANTNSTTLGFSVSGSISSNSNSNAILNLGECCQSYTLNVRKIIDNDCSGTVTAGDVPGQAWNFVLKDNLGNPIQTATTDINGELFFTNLSLGNYTIEEIVQPGYTPISPSLGIQNVTITANSFNTYDFFNCESPEIICDSLMVMVDEIPSTNPNGESLCCYSFDLKNNWGPGISNIEVEMLSKDWIFNNVTLDPSFNFGPCLPTNDLFCIASPSGSVPTGTIADAIEACIAPAVMNPISPQVIEFRWMQDLGNGESIVACRDTVMLECMPPPPPEPCVEVIECEVMCSNPDNPLEYELCFSLVNNSGFDIGSITVEDLTPGFGWLPFCTTSRLVMPVPNPIFDGTSSGQMCVKFKATTPIVLPQNICFNIGVVSVDGTECCHTPEEICKEIIPCCDPCEDNGIAVLPYGSEDECCFTIDLDNGCQTGYFTKFEVEILTPGVCIGSHVISPSQAAFWTINSTNSKITMIPISGVMDQASYPSLLDFCLDKLDDPSKNNPQIIFRWYAINPLTGLEEEVCNENYVSECEAPDENICMVVTDPLLVCVPDSNKYRYTFTVTNVSNPSFIADKLHLNIKNDPFNYVPFPNNVITLSPPLGPNQSRTISTCIVGTPFPQTSYSDFVFGYRLQNMATGDCCFESVCDTIPIPPCGDELGCCDISSEDFCNYFDNLLDYTQEECKVIFDFDDLDSCDVILLSLPDGSTVTPNIGDELCVPLGNNGPHQICVQIDRWNNLMNEALPCFSKDTCFFVDPPCPPPIGDLCPDCPTGFVANDLVVNGDFEAGNTGFSSDYLVGPPNLTGGEYDVRNSTTLFNSNWAATDPTNGALGSMLVADGPFAGAIWRQNINVTIGQTYDFCASFNNLVTLNLTETNPPLIEVHINGLVVIPATAIPQMPDQWVLLSGSYIATSSVATIEIFNVETNGFNDIAIDDVSFTECLPVMMDECCEDYDAFCDLVDLGWDISIVDCEVTVKATQFDSCHWMFYESPDWGDGGISLPTTGPANGCWTHEYDQTGTYNICATIYEGTMDGDTCWTKQLCVPVDVSCPECECVGWNEMTVSGAWGSQGNVTCGQTVVLPECEYLFTVDGSFLCNGGDCDPSFDWSLTKLGGSCVNPCFGNIGFGTAFNLTWDLSPNASPMESGPGTYELVINGSCSDDAACSPCIIYIEIPDCDSTCDPDADPCDFTDIDFTEDPSNDDQCCYIASIDNQYCDTFFKGLKITLSSPASISQIQTLPGWVINQLDPLNAEIYPNGPFIPLGLSDAFNICASNDGSPLNVQLSWLYADANGNCISICPEDFTVSCNDNPGGCLEIVQDSIDCDNNKYLFKVINTTTPNITIKSVEFIQISPSGASLTPNPISIAPLTSGNTSDWICATYDALGGPDLCFLLVGHEADLPNGEPVTWCCVDDEKYFINIEEDCDEDPPCPIVGNLCEDISVTLSPDPITGEECCFVGSINNDYCADYFKGIKIEMSASANISQVQTLNGWFIQQLSSTEAEVYPPGNYIDLGMVDVFSVCNTSNTNPFTVSISWLVADDQGNCIELCDEEFDLSCPVGVPVGGCITVVDEDLICDDDMYCFKITNNTSPGFTIRSLDLIGITPSSSTLNPNPISIPALMPGQTSDWICVSYSGIADGEELCFYVVGHNEDVTLGNVPTWCCATADPVCVDIACGDFCPPDCIAIVQDSLSCEDRNYCFKIVNNTHPGFDISSIDLINVLPSSASFVNTPISIPLLMKGDTSDWICVEYAGVMAGDSLCFNVVAHLEDVGLGEQPSWCCATTDPHCVVIEDCETCCQDELAFLDLVDLGFMSSSNDCQLSLTTMQFDSCHWMTMSEPDWGDGSVSQSVIIPANGTWTHTYAASGTYNVCIEIFEGDNGESNCWQASYCEDVTIVCPGIDAEPEDVCDLNLLRLPNGLTPNGDGINDLLIVEKELDCPDVSIKIFNRWGQNVYSSNSYENDWAGLAKGGDPLPDGTYYMVVGFNDDEASLIHTFLDIRR